MTTSDRERQFTSWIRDHGAILHKVANSFAAPADRDDLLQELLLAIWKALPAFRGDCRPSTFVYRVTHNAALTWKRARRHDDRWEPLCLETASERPAPDDGQAGEARRLDLLYAGLRRLPPLDRSLLLLSLDGVSYQDIAELHGLTPTNVGARLSRARQRLAHDLEGHLS